MSKRSRIIAAVIAGMLAILLAAGLWLYSALRAVPEFYTQALAANPEDAARDSTEMLQKLSALVSDVGRSQKWQALFTADQINGWLTVDIPQNHPHAIPPGISEPRVGLRNGRAILACRYEGPTKTVVWVELSAYVAEPNKIAVRIHRVRAGAVPLPLDEVLNRISNAARELNLELEWRQADADPVAVITVPPPRDSQRLAVTIQSLELREGEIYVAGKTEKGK